MTTFLALGIISTKDAATSTHALERYIDQKVFTKMHVKISLWRSLKIDYSTKLNFEFTCKIVVACNF